MRAKIANNVRVFHHSRDVPDESDGKHELALDSLQYVSHAIIFSRCSMLCFLFFVQYILIPVRPVGCISMEMAQNVILYTR